MGRKLCLVICENLVHELEAIVEGDEFNDVDIASFPVSCDRPHPLVSDFEAFIDKLKSECSRIRIMANGCMALLEPVLKKYDLVKYREQGYRNCFEMFISRGLVESLLSKGSYLITPGRLRNWRRYLDNYGFDKKTAREFFSESTRIITLIDTGISSSAQTDLREFAEYVDQPWDSIPAGLDQFRLLVENAVLDWRLEVERSLLNESLIRSNKVAADQATVLDLIGEITAVTNEETVVERIVELLNILFAPGSITYFPVLDGQACAPLDCSAEIPEFPSDFDEEASWTESGDGFLLKLKHHDDTMAIIKMDNLAFPGFREHYRDLGINIARVCGLAVFNTRTYKRLSEVTNNLRKSEERYKRISDTLQGALREEIELYRPGWIIRAHYEPALEEAEVGGDFYDLFEFEDGRIGLAVGDVSGKGLAAAVHTAMAKYMIRAYAHEDPDPCRVMRRLATSIYDYLPAEIFITIVLAVIEPEKGRITFTNAGHDPILLFKQASDRVVRINPTGPAIGIGAGSVYSKSEITLDTNDIILLYTDGITEARIGMKMLGVAGLGSILKSSSLLNVPDLINTIFFKAKQSAGGKLRDDAAVMVVKSVPL